MGVILLDEKSNIVLVVDFEMHMLRIILGVYQRNIKKIMIVNANGSSDFQVCHHQTIVLLIVYCHCRRKINAFWDQNNLTWYKECILPAHVCIVQQIHFVSHFFQCISINEFHYVGICSKNIQFSNSHTNILSDM